VDKQSGEDLLDTSRQGGIFRLVQEDDARGMTAWIVGRWMSVQNVHQQVKLSAVSRGSLRQWLSYEISFASSTLRATVSLDRDSAALCWSVECEWLEVGRKGVGIPQLNFALPLGAEAKAFRYDVPFGSVDREPLEQDLPANGWVFAVPGKAGARSVMLVADQKHAFRCGRNSMSLTLLRSSYDPDPYPELGGHRFSFSVHVAEGGTTARLARVAQKRAHPLVCLSGTVHGGSLPLEHGFLEVADGGVVVSAIKMPEEPEAGTVLVRLYETEGKKGPATLSFFRAPSTAWAVDLNEHRLEAGPAVTVSGTRVTVEMNPYSVMTLRIRFPERRQ